MHYAMLTVQPTEVQAVPTIDGKGQHAENWRSCIFITMPCCCFFAMAFMGLGYLKRRAGQDRVMVLVFYGNGILQDIDMEINHMKLYCIKYSKQL